MKKIIGIIFAVVILAVAVTGCADTTTASHAQSGWSTLYIGESQSDVQSALGAPEDRTSSNVGGTMVVDWSYGGLGSSHMYDVTFENGKVFSYSKF